MCMYVSVCASLAGLVAAVSCCPRLRLSIGSWTRRLSPACGRACLCQSLMQQVFVSTVLSSRPMPLFAAALAALTDCMPSTATLEAMSMLGTITSGTIYQLSYRRQQGIQHQSSKTLMPRMTTAVQTWCSRTLAAHDRVIGV